MEKKPMKDMERMKLEILKNIIQSFGYNSFVIGKDILFYHVPVQNSIGETLNDGVDTLGGYVEISQGMIHGCRIVVDGKSTGIKLPSHKYDDIGKLYKTNKFESIRR